MVTKSWVLRKDELTAFVKSIDKSAVLMTKDNWFCGLMAVLYRVFTGNAKERFIEDFASTIGPLIFIPETWDFFRAKRVAAHECGHVRQYRYFGLGIHPWVGLPQYWVAYLLLPFPIGISWIRYRLELAAEVYAWRYLLEDGASAGNVIYRASTFAETVAGWDYVKPWPQRWVRWGFMRKALKVIDEFVYSDKPNN